MRVAKNYLYNLSYQIFIIIVPLVTIPYISRVLGPTELGINTLTNSTVQYFVLFANLGLTTYGQRQIAYDRENRNKRSSDFWEIEVLSVVTMIVSYLTFSGFMIFNSDYKIFYFTQSLLIVASAFDVSWLFMGLENFRVTVFRNFVFKALSIILIFLLVHDKEDLIWYILIISGLTVLSNLSLWPFLSRYVDSPHISLKHISRHLRPALALFIPQIAISLYGILNKIMLGKLDTVQSAAYYDNSDKIIRLVLTVVTSFSIVMMPHIAKSFASGENGQIRRNIRMSLRFAFLFSIPVTAGIIAVAPQFVPIFFGKKFIQVIPVMQVESLALIPISVASILGAQYLVPLNRSRQYTISIFCGSIINVVINIPLILHFHSLGAAIATVIAEYVVTMVQIFFVRGNGLLRGLHKQVFQILFCSIGMLGAVSLFSFNIRSTIINLLISVLIGIVVFISVLFAINPKFVSTILNKIN